MKILITGCNGLLGQKLTRLIIAQGKDLVIATAKTPPVSLPPTCEFFKLDITSKDQIDEVIGKTKPDVLIHTAAMTQVDHCETEQEACWDVNVNAVRHIVNACNQNQVHLIHVSTDFIFDGKYGPLDENAEAAPVNYYGESKWAAEKIVQTHALSWAIIRTVLVFGITNDMSRSNIVLWVKNSLEEGKTIRVVNDQWRTPTLAEDLAMGCYLAASKKVNGVYNVSGEEMMTPFDIAIATARFFHLDTHLITATDSDHFKQPAARPLKTGFVIDKAKRELGYKPHTFEESLQVVADQIKVR